MKIDWKKVAHLGEQVIGVVVPGIAQVEKFWPTGAAGAGSAKQDAVVAMVQAQVAQTFAHYDSFLLFNARVIAAIRVVIDSMVALQQTIAEELQKAGKLSTSAPAPPLEP